LIEKTGAARGLNGIVARNLVGLLKAPRSLQSVMMGGSVGREVGFELARFWNKLLADNELRGDAKREIQYRNLLETWARARGAELDGQAMARYAAETFQDPKVVKATCRKAEASQRAVLERFNAIVAQAAKEGWRVERAKAELTSLRAKAGAHKATSLPCYEQARKGTRLTDHLDRVRNPELATPESLASLAGVLRDLASEVESRRTPLRVAPCPGSRRLVQFTLTVPVGSSPRARGTKPARPPPGGGRSLLAPARAIGAHPTASPSPGPSWSTRALRR
jgi:hypothetical protein